MQFSFFHVEVGVCNIVKTRYIIHFMFDNLTITIDKTTHMPSLWVTFDVIRMCCHHEPITLFNRSNVIELRSLTDKQSYKHTQMPNPRTPFRKWGYVQVYYLPAVGYNLLLTPLDLGWILLLCAMGTNCCVEIWAKRCSNTKISRVRVKMSDVYSSYFMKLLHYSDYRTNRFNQEVDQCTCACAK